MIRYIFFILFILFTISLALDETCTKEYYTCGQDADTHEKVCICLGKHIKCQYDAGEFTDEKRDDQIDNCLNYFDEDMCTEDQCNLGNKLNYITYSYYYFIYLAYQYILELYN